MYNILTQAGGRRFNVSTEKHIHVYSFTPAYGEKQLRGEAVSL